MENMHGVMPFYFTKSKNESGTVAIAENIAPARKPIELPPKNDDEELIEYVIAVKPNLPDGRENPIEYFTIAGESFQKRVYPPEASLAENQNKNFPPGLVTRYYTKRQADIILKAADRMHKVKQRNNNNWHEGSDEPDVFPAEKINLKDIIIIVPCAEFGMPAPKFFEKKEPEVEESVEAEINEQVYKAQAKRKK